MSAQWIYFPVLIEIQGNKTIGGKIVQIFMCLRVCADIHVPWSVDVVFGVFVKEFLKILG